MLLAMNLMVKQANFFIPICLRTICHHFFLLKIWSLKYIKVRKRTKIRNRCNQIPHLTQDTNGKVTNSKQDITNESQEVSPFPAGAHKATINRRALKHSKHKTKITLMIHKRSTALERSVKIPAPIPMTVAAVDLYVRLIFLLVPLCVFSFGCRALYCDTTSFRNRKLTLRL